MRITAGEYKGRKLETPKGSDVRPTSDKVRQAIFNALNARGFVQDAVVVDAFCGTGALGIEALSQGASFCTFFDKNKSSFDLCRSNVKLVAAEERTNVFLKDVTKVQELPEGAEKADLVFLDPPYRKDLVSLTVEALHNGGWLSKDCTLVIEAEKNEAISSPIFEITDEKIYGDTKILLAQMVL